MLDHAQSALAVVDRVIEACGPPTTWPKWSTRTFFLLACSAVVLSTLQSLRGSGKTSSAEKTEVSRRHAEDCTYRHVPLRPFHACDSCQTSKTNAGVWAFRMFQTKYLAVYLITMLADWLQGTNMYTLYSSYNMPVGTLFLTGFTSSAIFGTWLGLYVDRYGRKFGCIVFCVLEIVINTLEHFPNLWLLLLGRVLGGISTSLLFSAFESWMVTEHRKCNFPDEWLATTHGYASVGNGIMAVVAGVLAQVAADAYGDIGPFRLAIALTVVTLVLVVLTWKENYGEQSSQESSFSVALKEIMSKREILLLGLIQSFFEGAMYTFVFMWVPTILKVAPSEPPVPLGLVFASFMVCITIGGGLFTPLLEAFSVEVTTVLICACAATTMLVPVLTEDFALVFAAFLVLEACVGCWFACSGTLRSSYIPETLQSSIMTVFRIPLNLLVITGTKVGHALPPVPLPRGLMLWLCVLLQMEELAAPSTVFKVTASWFGISCLLQVFLAAIAMGNKKAKENKED